MIKRSLLLFLVLSPLNGTPIAANIPTSPIDECTTVVSELDLWKWLPRGSENGDQTQEGASRLTIKVMWSGSGAPRYIRAQVSATALPGICNNKGDTSAPDLAFPIFDMVNGKWTAEDGDQDILAYANNQYLSVRTLEEIPAESWVFLTIASYDFGGSGTLRIQADGCQPSEPLTIPRDLDHDRLPDYWEQSARFFDQESRKLKKYDIAIANTSGFGIDGDTDLDVGYRFLKDNLTGNALRNAFAGAVQSGQGAFPHRLHNELGDGFTAFEEYRGFFVQGVHRRTDELSNLVGLNPHTSIRGTALKNVFLHDPENAVTSNVFLMKHGIAYHKVQATEMKDVGTPSDPKGGIMDSNGEGAQQRGIFLRKGGLPNNVLGFAGSLSINADPIAITLDLNKMLTHSAVPLANGEKESFADLRDYVVAHEIGHKLDLRHTSREVSDSNEMFLQPTTYNNSIYKVLDATSLLTWIAFQHLGGGDAYFLETMPPQQGVTFGDATPDDTNDVSAQIHGETHTARRFKWPTSVNLTPHPRPVLEYWIHSGDLMDWTHEHARLSRSN